MKEIIQTDQAPAPIGPYNQAVKSRGMVYTSGQIAINPENGALMIDNIQVETEWVMKNVQAVLKAAKLDFSDVVKATIYLRDMDNFSKVNEVYSRYFNEDTAPARECIQVAALPKNVNVEVSVIAAEP